jgi:hypothetical protein
MSYRKYRRCGALAAALLAGTAVTASAQTTGPLVGTNYANGNRYNSTIQIADLDAMKAAGVDMIRTPLENYYGSYNGSHNVFAAAIARGIGVHMNVTLNNPDLYPPGTQKRLADPVRPSIYAFYQLSDLDPDLVETVMRAQLQRLEAAGVKLVAIEFGNELGNPSFNGDLKQTAQNSVLLGFDDLLNAATPETEQFDNGIRRYIEALARVRLVLGEMVLNRDTPLVSAGLNNPGDCPAGRQLAIPWMAVEADGLLQYMRANGMDQHIDWYGQHAYYWGDAAMIHKLSSTLTMRQCTSPGDKIGKPCAITEWGWQWEPQTADQKCPANNDTSRRRSFLDFRNDMAGYGDKVAMLIQYDWKGARYGIFNPVCGGLLAAGPIALQR